MELNFSSKVAIVTGATGGIGWATAKAFAQSGAAVVLADINTTGLAALADEIDADGGQALPIHTDVSKKVQVEAMARKTLETFGRIDVLVNNAGIAQTVSIMELTEEDWDFMMDVNLKSVLFCSQIVIPTMIEQGWGRIINMGSMAGKTGGRTIGANYVVSKAGVMALTKSFATFLSQYQVTVNALAPGIVDTPMAHAVPRGDQAKKVPLGRLAKPEEIANLILFLASEQAGYITGEIVDINGGMIMD